jgi:hypothetical protein
MKITVNTTVTKEIELPLYFKSVKHPDHYFMLIGDQSAIEVTNFEISDSLILYPSIEVVSINTVAIYADSGVTPISETEFKLVFTMVTNRIEALLN